MLPRKEREQISKEYLQQIKVKELIKSQQQKKNEKNQDFVDTQKRMYDYVYENPMTKSKNTQSQTLLDSSAQSHLSPFQRMSQRTTHQQTSSQLMPRYGTYTSKLDTSSHPNRDYATTQHTSKTNKSSSKFDETFKIADSIFNEDKSRGAQQVFDNLNQMVNKYESPNIFADSKRRKYMPTHYRDKPTENTNQVMNNNTFLRVFDVNRPADPKYKPILDQNVEGIRPKESFLTYKADNKGILRRNRSQHFKQIQPSQLQSVNSERQFDNTHQQLFLDQFDAHQPPIPDQALKSSIHSLGSFVESAYNNQSHLRNSHNPLMFSGQNQLQSTQSTQSQAQFVQNAAGVQNERNHLHPVHKSTKVGNSFNEIESKKNVLNRMLQNEVRSRMLANDFIQKDNHNSAFHNQTQDIQIHDQSKYQQTWNPPQSVVINEQVPQQLINKNPFYQIDQVYQTIKSVQKEKPQILLKDSPFLARSGYYDTQPIKELLNMPQSTQSLQNYPHVNNFSKSIHQVRYNESTRNPVNEHLSNTQSISNQQFQQSLINNQPLPQKAQFKDMLQMSQVLDKNIKSNMQSSGSGGKIMFF
eukprot:403334378